MQNCVIKHAWKLLELSPKYNRKPPVGKIKWSRWGPLEAFLWIASYLPVIGDRSKKSVATRLSNVKSRPKRLVNLCFFKHSKMPANSSDLNKVKTSFLSEFSIASTRVQAIKLA